MVNVSGRIHTVIQLTQRLPTGPRVLSQRVEGGADTTGGIQFVQATLKG